LDHPTISGGLQIKGIKALPSHDISARLRAKIAQLNGRMKCKDSGLERLDALAREEIEEVWERDGLYREVKDIAWAGWVSDHIEKGVCRAV
jgi:hypothetical protein